MDDTNEARPVHATGVVRADRVWLSVNGKQRQGVRHERLIELLNRQHKTRGQKLIVADLLKHELAERADVFLRPNPGTDLIWLNAVARHIIDRWKASRKAS